MEQELELLDKCSEHLDSMLPNGASDEMFESYAHTIGALVDGKLTFQKWVDATFRVHGVEAT